MRNLRDKCEGQEGCVERYWRYLGGDGGSPSCLIMVPEHGNYHLNAERSVEEHVRPDHEDRLCFTIQKLLLEATSLEPTYHSSH